MDELKITAYSSAMFSTWIFVENYGIAFDCGDGICSGLLQKSRKIKVVAISHADRDHLTGLLQLLQLNGREGGLPRVLYPSDCGSFPALAQFCSSFDPQTSAKAAWSAVKPGDRIAIDKDLELLVVHRSHVYSAESKVKSVGYLLLRKGKRLKSEYQGLSQYEIRTLALQRSQSDLMQNYETPLIGYSGDGPAEKIDQWRGCKILFHESTFLTKQDADAADRNVHSVLVDVLLLAKELQPEKLVLYHFSTRYTVDQIRDAIISGARNVGLSCEIGFVPPAAIVSKFDL